MTRLLKTVALVPFLLPAAAAAEVQYSNLPARPYATAPSFSQTVANELARTPNVIFGNLPARAEGAPSVTQIITGGTTRVELIDFTTLGLTPGISGTTTIFSPDPLTVDFPITGGQIDLELLTGQIFHDGAGLTLTGGTDTLGFANFILDVTNQTLLGDVTLNGAGLADDAILFTFDLASVTLDELTDLDNPSLALLLSADAAAVLTQVFGAPDLTGTQIGLAATAPVLAAIPEPATWGMLISGFGLVGAQLRRTRVRVAVAA